MNSNHLRKLIREIINRELEEVSTSSAAGPYDTPFAFKKNKDNDVKEDPFKPKAFGESVSKYEIPQNKADINKKNKEIIARAEEMGNTLDKRRELESDEKPEDYQDTKKAHTPVPFGDGKKTKLEEAITPKQQIAHAISEIHHQLKRIDDAVSLNAQLKMENNLTGTGLWKRTFNQLSKMEGQLIEIARKIREMKA